MQRGTTLPMRQSLELKLGARVTMTPQLQHAIRLLQLSAVDLAVEIQQALQTNPLLEEIESEESSEEGPAVDMRADPISTDDDPVDSHNDGTPEGYLLDGEGGADGQLSDDAPAMESIDESGWDELFDSPIAPRTRSDADARDFEIDARNSAPTTLKDHLAWQAQMTPFSPCDARIAQAIVSCIDAHGYLTCTLEELQQILDEEEGDVGLDEIEAVLHHVQSFEPTGVAARSLSECLVLQLRQLPLDSDTAAYATTLVTDHLHLLGSRDYARLRRLLGLGSDELQRLVEIVRGLNPKPGNAIGPSDTVYVTPDLIARKIKNRWQVELNNDSIPGLRISQSYQELMRHARRAAERKYLQDRLQDARWFLKSLRTRNETLLAVGREIVKRQHEFLDQGDIAMKPLVLADIAGTLNLHESTVSRVTTQKYLMTPRGIFELKYFFSSSVGTADGGSFSATAIRSLIRKLVQAEVPTKPMSDSEIAGILGRQGIQVARRTVAKYREHMNIPPSSRRKALL